jgi:hypothetical protein
MWESSSNSGNQSLARALERDFAALVPLVRWLDGAIGCRTWERRY